MGLTEKKKTKQVNDKLKVNKSDFKPASFSSPYGSISYDARGNATYDPMLSAEARMTRSQGEAKILDLTKGMPTSWTAEDLYNNPFFESTNRMLQQPIAFQQEVDNKELLNRMAARNQVGSSYEAYQNDLNARRFDQLRQSASDSARAQSADAYNMAFDNRLKALSGLRADLAGAQDMAYQPLTYANQTTQANMPLRLSLLDQLQQSRTAQANMLAQQKTAMEKYFRWQNQGAEAAGVFVNAAAGGGGGESSGAFLKTAMGGGGSGGGVAAGAP